MYQEKHNATLYSFALMGNHDHVNATFPEANRASFMRDFNSQIARLTKRLVSEVGKGKFWEKRYSEQELARNEDIEEYFFYCALQAVSTELADHPDKYNQYNSFQDAVSGVEREYLVTNWTKYSNARRWNCNVDINKYQTSYKPRYTRPPGNFIAKTPLSSPFNDRVHGDSGGMEIPSDLNGIGIFAGRQPGSGGYTTDVSGSSYQGFVANLSDGSVPKPSPSLISRAYSLLFGQRKSSTKEEKQQQ